jgi:phage-related minor tail protein
VAVDELKAALGLNSAAMEVNVSAGDAMAGMLSALTGNLSIVTGAAETAAGAANVLAGAWNAAAAGAHALADAANAARNAVQSIPSHVSTTITTIRETVERAVGPRQHGGPVGRGNPYLVGERGPEIFVPHSSGSIISNRAATTMPTAARASSMGGPIVLQVDGTTFGVLAQAYGSRRVALATM